jgi:type I restriction enzyme S subunit
MHAFLQSRERLRSLSTGSTHKTIYFPTVEQFKVLVPPLVLQDTFAQRIVRAGHGLLAEKLAPKGRYLSSFA